MGDFKNKKLVSELPQIAFVTFLVACVLGPVSPSADFGVAIIDKLAGIFLIWLLMWVITIWFRSFYVMQELPILSCGSLLVYLLSVIFCDKPDVVSKKPFNRSIILAALPTTLNSEESEHFDSEDT